jgi:hypothetical protein
MPVVPMVRVVMLVLVTHFRMPRFPRVVLRQPRLERLELMEHLIAVERPDVSRLDRRESANGPAEVNKVRLDGVREGMHPDFFGQTIPLASVARAAGGDDVRPIVRTAARQRNEVVPGERLSRLELGHVSTAVLTTVLIAREQERVGDVTAEPARHMDKPRQTDDGRSGDGEPLRPHEAIVIGFDDLGLAVNHEPQGALHRNHRQWLEGSIQRQAPQNHVLKLRLFPKLYKRERGRSRCLNSS